MGHGDFQEQRSEIQSEDRPSHRQESECCAHSDLCHPDSLFAHSTLQIFHNSLLFLREIKRLMKYYGHQSVVEVTRAYPMLCTYE